MVTPRDFTKALEGLVRLGQNFTSSRNRSGGMENSMFAGTIKNVLTYSGLYRIQAGIFGLIGEVSQLQKTLLSYRTDISKANNFLGDSIKGLDGSTLKNLKNAVTLYGMGFRDNNKQLLKLANIMDMTGQDTASFMEALPDVAFNLRLNTDGLGDLQMATLAVGEKYGVATDKLIKTISQLPVFKTAGLTDFGPQLSKAFAEITARLGPAGESVARFASEFLTDQKNIGVLAAAGALELRSQAEKAAAAGDKAGFVKYIGEAAEKVSRFTNTLVVNNAKAMEGTFGQIGAIEMLQPIVGTFGADAVKVSTALQNFDLTTKKSAETNFNYSESLSVAIDKLTTQFLPVIVTIVESLTYVIDVGGKMLNNKFVLVVGALALLIKGIGPAVTAVGTFAQSVLYGARRISLAMRQMEMARAGVGATSMMGATRLGLGALGGPLGIALTGISLAIPLIMAIGEKNEENIKKTAEAAQRQKDLMEQEAEAKRNQNKQQETAYASVFRMINRDLMFAITSNRADIAMTQQIAKDQTDLLRAIYNNGKKSLDANFNLPTRKAP